MAIKKRKISPRQKMINLMYVVLMAMLALNISTEVLNGFSVVEESLNRTTGNSSKENEAIFGELDQMMRKNPQKVKQWFMMASTVREMSDSLYNYAQALKVAIVREADGEKGDPLNIEGKDNIEAASYIMLNPANGQGHKLYEAINSYRARILQFVTDPRQKKIIASNLSTEVPHHSMGKNWEEYMFENMPVAAAVTLLSKLQSDVRYAEGEVLHTLVANVGLKDIRVNKLQAFVVPSQTRLYPGETMTAQMFMGAVDSTQQPQVFVNGQLIKGNQITVKAGAPGKHTLNGYILIKDLTGNVLCRNFSQDYWVTGGPQPKEYISPQGMQKVPPFDGMATIAADLMNVLYAGFDNPITISIPNTSQHDVQATMSGGSLVARGGGHFIARPSAVGQPVTISVSAKGRKIGDYQFRVRKLPDPSPYIAMGADRFNSGALSKAALMSAPGIQAAIDDGLLDIPFSVTSFRVVFFDNMGNAVPLASNGASFSPQQKEQFRQLSRNKRFYITNVVVHGPDGTTRTLNGRNMEVIVR
ncbi:gliding motility protein GldM [Prevotella melaninogenica]|uniref:type IX secretion system motor protein PorM/GldM n=1 Tax=Prevotella melaninogenica TaxID=28132 RepID=UPI001BA9EB3D|nr:gliding motility protein GldM [Prevotella melaninogenica]QUB61194.1 gliding motility protein GldM [Prevotella melaninogenica]